MQRGDIIRLEYHDENTFKCFVKNRAGSEDYFLYNTKESFSPVNVSHKESSYTPRLSAPERNNPYYFSKNIFYNSGFGMTEKNIGNCTCYAYGRAYEILGTAPNLSSGNAGEWYDYNRRNGFYPYGDIPAPGAIAVWSKRGGAGHVAVVESVDGDTIITSESGWKSFYFKTRTRSASDPNLSASSAYTFLGFIYIAGEPELLPPSDVKIESSGTKTTVSWNKALGATSYVCRIVNAKEGFYDAAPPVRTESLSATFLLPEGETYYAYITSEDADLSSELSKPFIFGTTSGVCIWNIGTTDAGTTIAWEAAPFAESYLLDVMESTEGNPKIIDSLAVSSTYYTLSLPDGTYYAAITPVSNSGSGVMSPWYLFQLKTNNKKSHPQGWLFFGFHVHNGCKGF
ncbi:MAG: CHAP domain-containing protein [Clostridia bacterium]|nr:CHAP domain-containing protein [Clostridia bacterium]